MNSIEHVLLEIIKTSSLMAGEILELRNRIEALENANAGNGGST